MSLQPAPTPPPPPKPNKRRLAVVGLVVVAAAAVAVVNGVSSRAATDRTLAQWANAQATPTVALTQATPDTGTQDLTLPGTIQAFVAAPIYGQVAGYVKSWSFDIGAKVQKGQVLAEIEAPSVDQQLAQAQANLANAVAAGKLAAITAIRWHTLVSDHAVSQQDADQRVTNAQTAQAQVQAAEANVRQLQAMENFKHLVAPFDGIVTARNTDIGALVNPSSASGQALFQVSDIHKVRIYVQMPQAFASALTPGLKATLTLPDHPDSVFEASLTNTSNSFSESSRTVSVQLQADNPDGKLWPGSYAEVTFHVPSDPHVLRVPATALVFGPHGMQIATLGPDGKVLFKDVKLGRDLGNEAEILSGITQADQVILSPPEWLSNGDTVRTASAATLAKVASTESPRAAPSEK